MKISLPQILTVMLLFNIIIFQSMSLSEDSNSNIELPKTPEILKTNDTVYAENLKLTISKDVLANNFKEKYPLYFASTPNFTPMFIESFLHLFFGVKPLKVASHSSRFTIQTQIKGQLFRFYKDGSIDFVSTVGSTYVLSNKIADSLAKQYFQKIMQRFSNFYPSIEINNISSSKQYCSANYIRKSNGLKVYFNRLNISLKQDGSIKNFKVKWRNLQKIDDYPIMSIQEAVEQIKNGNGIVLQDYDISNCTGTITKVHLSYKSGFLNDSTTYMQPVYGFKVLLKNIPQGGKAYGWVYIQAIKPKYIDKTKSKEAKQAL